MLLRSDLVVLKGTLYREVGELSGVRGIEKGDLKMYLFWFRQTTRNGVKCTCVKRGQTGYAQAENTQPRLVTSHSANPYRLQSCRPSCFLLKTKLNIKAE